MLENENVEFKQIFTENVYKEIVAFLNSSGGTIYIGYDDSGNLIGLNNAKRIEEKISNGLIQKITPDCSVFVSINTNNIDNLEYITINVSKGINLYYIKEKGIVKGTYIRNGSCSIPATEETVKQLIIKNSNLSFETSVANNQKLTFDYAKKCFAKINLDIANKNIIKNLNYKDNNGKYTNLALLFSDQNPYSIKIAVYETKDKAYFIDRKEFTGSLLEIYDETIKYLQLNSSTYGLINKTIRQDIESYPEFILREITLNSLIHRDYSTLTSNIINVYQNSEIEFINYGSLYGDITIEDILAGLSTTRNPRLQSVFMRLHYIEAIGSGLNRVNSYYHKYGLQMNIKALPSSFVVTLPKFILLSHVIGGTNDLVIDYIKDNGYITRKVMEELLGKEKTTAVKVLNGMVDNNILTKTGNGPSTKYILK